MKSLTLPTAKLRHLHSLSDGATFVDRVPCKKQPGEGVEIRQEGDSLPGRFYIADCVNGAWRGDIKAPHAPGELLYVKERYSICLGIKDHTGRDPDCVFYESDKSSRYFNPYTNEFIEASDFFDQAMVDSFGDGWQSARTMPREYARLFLRVVSVRPERVQSITEEDALLEGFQSTVVLTESGDDYRGLYAGEHFMDAWDARFPRHPFDGNPYCWRTEYVKETP